MPDNISNWALFKAEFAFFASAFIVVIATINFFARLFTQSKLEIRLTNEIFFRISDFGESLFANAVFLAHRGPVLIRDAYFELTTVDMPKKTFILQLVEFGEKVRTLGNIADYHWFSTSPLAFLMGNFTFRYSYLCTHKGYNDRIEQQFNSFKDEVIRIKVGSEATIAEDINRPDMSPQEFLQKRAALIERVEELKRQAIASILDVIQIDKGKYILTVYVKYQPKMGLWAKEKTAKSSISFTVSSDIRANWRLELERCFGSVAKGILEGTQTNIIYPEFKPEMIKELSERGLAL